MYKPVFLFLVFIYPLFLMAQQEADSSKTLDEVVVKAFEQNRKLKESTFSVKVIETNNADLTNKTSLVNGFNTIAGVRMEERSPGSYRINIRGSSLRSPFGVRNVKVYWNDIPVTDAGGNTYFNQFAFNNFSSITIMKGPAGSLYGAGTGGLILLNTLDRWQPGASIEYVTGSYNLQNILAAFRYGKNENKNQLTYAHTQSDGYRNHSAVRRDNFTWESKLKISDRQELDAAVLFTDMYYETPGALTLNEYNINAKAARPAVGTLPSAEKAKAAIYQKTVTAGLTSNYTINSFFKNTTTLYGTFAQVKNPAIRNYERRNEPGYGARTVFTYEKKKDNNRFQLVAGSEFQQGFFNTQVSKNKNGLPDTLQTNDDINNITYNFFIQGEVSLSDKWIINTGLSVNKTKVEFTRLSGYPVIKQTRTYQNELAPKISLRRNIQDDFYAKATISRGFSPPTIAELLPSTGVISTSLEAEYGWNYEASLGYYLLQKKLLLEVTGFIFKLNNGLVQRRDASGADYFVNAGNIKQRGIEMYSSYLYTGKPGNIIDYINTTVSFTLNHFRYGEFIKGTDNFSGKQVPSVPNSTLSVLADIHFKKRFYITASYYTASKIYLDDANSAAANPYHLAGARIGWMQKTIKHKLSIYAGIDNLLNEKYSLGNDINAAGNRFYNAAASRNFYAGISYQFIQPKK
ncbi:MAG: TonB-dependent receptor [Sphingobacteriales bacterium]|nr:TonB-dependent receptor [Sphingobacteriales bacterium]MBI3718796.1 TonB-dependent receptor [Sphingobacteriales bacterium]